MTGIAIPQILKIFGFWVEIPVNPPRYAFVAQQIERIVSTDRVGSAILSESTNNVRNNSSMKELELLIL